MKLIRVLSLEEDKVYIWAVPSKEEALRYSRETFGHRFDPVEGRMLSGGLPMVWGCRGEENEVYS